MDAAKGAVTRVKDWAAAPVTQDMDLVNVALTTAFVATIAFLWTRVLAQITE